MPMPIAFWLQAKRMADPDLPSVDDLILMHDLQLVRFGGGAGLRDRGALESAVGRAQNLFAYDDKADAILAAATLCHSVVKNHAFVDGNKRAALAALSVTLALNGLRLEATSAEVAQVVLDMATGAMAVAELDKWLRTRVVTDGRFQSA